MDPGHDEVTGVEEPDVEASGLIGAALELDRVRHPAGAVRVRGLHAPVRVPPRAVERTHRGKRGRAVAVQGEERCAQRQYVDLTGQDEVDRVHDRPVEVRAGPRPQCQSIVGDQARRGRRGVAVPG